MNAPVIIYDTSHNKVAYLPLAFDVAYHMRANELGRAWFSVPLDDTHLSVIQELCYAEIYNGETRVELFRIITSWKDQKNGKEYQRFECEHALGTLMDYEFDDTFYEGVGGTADAITDILAEDPSARWQLGTCAFTESYLYEWARGTSLLKALLDVPKRFQSGYFWTYDTTTYPWTINLIEPPTDVTAYVDYGRNMKAISRKKDLSGLVTKLYPHGANAGADQIDITSETGGDAFITNNIGTYGTITHHWTDQRYKTAAELYAAAVDHLAIVSEPAYTYWIDQADLILLTGESIDVYTIGALVKVDNPEISITTEVRVMEIKKSDVTGKPGDIKVTFANKGQEFDLSPKLGVNDLSGVNITDMPGGVPGQMPAAPDGAGLYVTTDYLGYHTGAAWATYMDITGKLWAEHGGYYIHFDPAADPPLTIRADGTWEGAVSISNLTVGSLGVAMTLTTGGKIESSNFVTGTSGWQIDRDGSAEFQDVVIRGTLNASDLDAGSINFATIGRANLSIIAAEIGNGQIIYGKIFANAVRTAELYIDGDLQFKPGAVWNNILGIDSLHHSDAGDTANPFITLAETTLYLNSGTTIGNDIIVWAKDKLEMAAQGQISLTSGGATLYVDGNIRMTALPNSDPSITGVLYHTAGYVRISL